MVSKREVAAWVLPLRGGEWPEGIAQAVRGDWAAIRCAGLSLVAESASQCPAFRFLTSAGIREGLSIDMPLVGNGYMAATHHRIGIAGARSDLPGPDVHETRYHREKRTLNPGERFLITTLKTSTDSRTLRKRLR